MRHNPQNPTPAWMIDASHNIKDPLEGLIQSLEAIQQAYAKALLIDQKALREAQQEYDVVRCQEILQESYHTDVRPLLQRARLDRGGALHPLATYRRLGVRVRLIEERGRHSVSTATSINMNYGGRRMRIGVGIHDSSAALLPYVKSSKRPFVLVSTGTWSVSLNPFAQGALSTADPTIYRAGLATVWHPVSGDE
jgi:hypothetical protein